MSRLKQRPLTTAKPDSDEEIVYANGVKTKNEILDIAAGEKRTSRWTDLIMRFTPRGKNRKSRASLLRTSDVLYSLLCSTYTTYSSNKEKLAITAESLKEVKKEHEILHQAILEKHRLLHNYKDQQKRMKNEKIWFKSKIDEHKSQRTILLAREGKLQEKMDNLQEEYKSDKTRLDHLTDELDISPQHQIKQFIEAKYEKQDDDDLKALLNDITDSDINLTKKDGENEIEGSAQANTEYTESTEVSEPSDKEQSDEYLKPVKEEEKGAELPKAHSSKKRDDHKEKSKNKFEEATIQDLICEDLLTLEGISDDELEFPFEVDRKKKKTKAKKSGSKVTITSESTFSLVLPKCPCKKPPKAAILDEE